jgi:hypothetical protein
MLNTRYILVPSTAPSAKALRSQTDRYRFVFAAGHTDVLENLRAMPRAFVVPASGIEVIADETLQLQRVKDPAFNPEQHVVLANAAVDAPAGAASSASSDKAAVEWIHRDTNSFQLRANAPAPSVLVASQIYYPGWKATIDGVAVPVVPADYALAAISLPSGTHDVRFFYAPSSIKIGGIASSSSILTMAFLAWYLRRRPGTTK